MVLYLSNTTWTHYQLHPQYIVDILIVCFGMDKVNNTFDMLALILKKYIYRKIFFLNCNLSRFRISLTFFLILAKRTSIYKVALTKFKKFSPLCSKYESTYISDMSVQVFESQYEGKLWYNCHFTWFYCIHRTFFTKHFFIIPPWKRDWYFLYTNANVYTQRHSVLSFENEFINVKDVKSL